jgi:hypothetical protein
VDLLIPANVDEIAGDADDHTDALSYGCLILGRIGKPVAGALRKAGAPARLKILTV